MARILATQYPCPIPTFQILGELQNFFKTKSNKAMPFFILHLLYLASIRSPCLG